MTNGPTDDTLTPLPSLPDVEGLSADEASVTYSTHRTKLSTRRTGMSMRRTGMSLQRTRMSADRTLMSVIRTALSLIGFGFTINQAFEKLHEAGTIASARAAGNFGTALVVIGLLVLTMGMIGHGRFMLQLRRTRRELVGESLIYGQSVFPVSFTFITAVALLLLGLAAIATMVFKLGPL